MRDKLIEILDAKRKWPDAAETADAIIAALPDMVEPLEWKRTPEFAYVTLPPVQYQVREAEGGWYAIEDGMRTVVLANELISQDEGIKMVDAHHRTKILSAFSLPINIEDT